MKNVRVLTGFYILLLLDWMVVFVFVLFSSFFPSNRTYLWFNFKSTLLTLTKVLVTRRVN